MAEARKFRVVPYIPEQLAPLKRIAYNMWWIWNYEAIDLFRRLDVDLWRECNHNPVAFLGLLSQDKLDSATESPSFLAHMKRIDDALNNHISKTSWFSENYGDVFKKGNIAYFSAEFGIHESLPIYSGGLGILAGDHLKSASEIGAPLFGVGLLYRYGYFHQYLSADGWQQEKYPETNFANIPITRAKNENGENVEINLQIADHLIYANVWQVNVGRVILYLLDTNHAKNSLADRALTANLYGGDTENRIKQEMLLGIGGVRALKALGKEISVYHMNEGHSAFLAIERIINAMQEKGLSYEEASEFVMATSVFTTHTPVPAGNDRFSPKMVEKYLASYAKQMGLSISELLGLGREDVSNKDESFCMTVLAIKTAASCNGVSELHGAVSRDMWKNIWPSLPVHEVPIDHITNGIQTLSWISDEMMRLYNRYLGPSWSDEPMNTSVWKSVNSIPDSELWRCRERQRERLIGFARRRLKKQRIARGVPQKEINNADYVLDPEALTIVFARRFATYKRATLILQNMERLERILLNRDFPVQIIFAGKAHPQDDLGKDLIKQVVALEKDPRFRNKIVFLEDYDINVARYLTQGADIWLNNPIRPQEASGTSGMKVIPNGGLNLSVLDGWWPEGYNKHNGWSIGLGEDYLDLTYQNEVESQSLYNMLEMEIIPMFYDREDDALPKEWISRIKDSIQTLAPVFNTNRMVSNYVEKVYLPAYKNSLRLSENDYAAVKEITKFRSKLAENWHEVAVENVLEESESYEVTVGAQMAVKSIVELGKLQPEDVIVQLHFGHLDDLGFIRDGVSVNMDMVEKQGSGHFLYEGKMLCLQSGEFAYTIRIIPNRQRLNRDFETNLITWY